MWSLRLEFRCKIRVHTRGLVPEASPCDKSPSVCLGRFPFNQNFRTFRFKTEWNGSVQPEKFRKDRPTSRGGPLFSVGPVRSKWTVPFDHSDPFSIPVPRCAVFSRKHELTWRKTLSMQLLWIVNSGSIGDTHASTCSYNRSGAASQAKGMFWLLTALKYFKDDLFPERIWNVLIVVRK